MRRAFVVLAVITCLGMVAMVSKAHAIEPEAALAASRAAIGSQPAPHAFTDTRGKRVTLADFRGRPLIVSFVYTGCSQVCPTTTRFLATAVREARAVVGPDFGVVSIGFNVPSDNPVSMRVFARQNGIDDDPAWSFLTPDAGTTEALARDFGFSYAAAAGGFEHLTQVTVLDAQGRVAAQIYGESFAMPMLVKPLRELALGLPVSASIAAAVDRVRLLCTVYDPVTGKYRLDYALFVEMFAGLLVLGATLGFLLRERRRARQAC